MLWDDHDLEIVGSYRIGEGANILQKYDLDGFYTQTLFELEQFADYSILVST